MIEVLSFPSPRFRAGERDKYIAIILIFSNIGSQRMTSSRHLILAALLAALPGLVRAEDAASAFQSRVLPVLKSHCGQCHGAEKPKAKISLNGARTLEQLGSEKDAWFRVLAQIESGAMPPEGEKQLTAPERQAITTWIRGELTILLAEKQLKEGRAKLRRLSRTEYANTVEDLFGARPLVGSFLPEDGRVDGYDKVSSALPLSAEGSLGYFSMVDALLKKWVLKPLPKEGLQDLASRTTRAIAMESGESGGHTLKLEDGTMVSFNSDNSSGRLNYRGVRIPGIHHIRCSVYGYQTDKPLPFGIYIGNTNAYPQSLELVKVLEAPPGKAAVVECSVYLRAGVGMRLIPFGIGVQVPKNSQAIHCKGPGLAVQWMEETEPELPLKGDLWLTADFPKALDLELRNQRKVFLHKAAAKNTLAKSVTRDEFLAVMKTTFTRVGARFYRRDLTTTEIDKLVDEITKEVDAGTPLDVIFLDMVAELMTSPEFLCIIEDPGRLSDFALASRLSYFLWSSTPDEPLLELARQGKLRDPKVLKEQTERLLKGPKGGRFVTDFVDQWLGLRAIEDTSPDANLYPEYDPLLKLSSVWETQGFIRKMLEENLSVRHLVASPWMLINERLAKHYGVPDVKGVDLRVVKIPEQSPHGGLWTQSSVMKVTANGTNTSPVKRGVWVAERLLGTPIPPPPPNINPVEPDVRGAKTLREQLALHRGSGSCAACHAKFDPYGFALESFDVQGHYRMNYRIPNLDVIKLAPHQRKGRLTFLEGLPVDPSGKTPDGHDFANISELRQLLSKNLEPLATGVTRHLLTYSTGAPASAIDRAAIEGIVKNAASDEYGLRSLVHALVQSEVFRSK